MKTITFVAGRLLCGQIRSYLQKRQFCGAKIEWFEGSGLVQRDWAVKGDEQDIDAVEKDIREYFNRLA